MANGEVNTNTYSSSVGSAYLKLTWNATSKDNGKYQVNCKITAHGIAQYYWLAVHKLRVVVNEIKRYEVDDIGVNAYNETTLTEFSFESDAGDYEVKLYGGFYSYGVENVSGYGTMKLEALRPSVSISEISKTATSIKVKASVTNNIGASKYIFNCDGVTKETSSNECEFTGLTPNKKYSLKAKGYANGGYGEYGNTLYITTLSQSTITSIGDFDITGGNLTLSGKGNIVVIIDGKEVVRRNDVLGGEYSLIFTEEEKDVIYKLMGNENSIDAIIRVETGNSHVDKEINITLTGDVFSCIVNVNGINKRGKVWVGTSTGNKQGIFTVGTSTGNVRGK